MIHGASTRRTIMSSGGKAKLPLDTISGAVAVYSLRRMVSSYAGACVNIRRSSDNTNQDIGFTSSGDFNVAAFSAFVGGGNGFVATWYDQSGGGRNATQGTLANQPQLMLGVTPTGRPALFASATSVGLTGTIPAATLPLTINGVASRTGGLTSFSNIVSLSGGTNPPALFYVNAPGIATGNTGLDSININGSADNAFHSSTGVFNGASSSLTVDSMPATATLANQPGSTSILPVAFSLIGYVTEVTYFNVAVSAANVAALGGSQKAYWGQATNVFTPITGDASYKLVFDDEFAGTSLDTTNKWFPPVRQADNTYTGGQGEMQTTTVSVHDGLLDLSVIRGPTPGGFNYGTAAINTRGSTINGQTIAVYWEARIKNMDSAIGLASDWWTDVAPGFTQPEADFSEYWQSAGANQTHFNYNDGSTWVLSGPYNYGQNLASRFHTYGCWWTATGIKFYIDGGLTNQTATNTNKTTQMWYGILNATVGGGGNFPDGTTVLPAHMLVDYVHVYSAQAGAVAITPDADYGGPGDCRRS